MLNVYRMEFTWYLLASWAVIAAYAAWRPKLRLDAALFVFLLMSIVETVVFTVLTMTLEWVDYPKHPETFVNLLLLRNVLRPFLYLFAASAVVCMRGWRRWSTLTGTLLTRYLLTWISERNGIFELVKLNYAHVLLIDSVLIAASCAAAVGFLRYAQPKGVAG